MQTTSIRLYAFNFSDTRTYLTATAFIVGNILFPQLCHLLPQGGNDMASYLFLHAHRSL